MSSLPLRVPGLGRHGFALISVVLFHVAAIWMFQTGLLHRAIEMVVPVALITDIIEPPKPTPPPPPPAPPKPAVVQKTVPKPEPPRPAPAPVLQPIVTPEPPPPTAPTAVAAPPAPLPPIAAPVAVAAPPAPPAPPPPAPSPRVELPSSDASYLNNPSPAYPNVSRRLKEQGTVLIRVYITVDGRVGKAEIKQSSGFERLDTVALETVSKWRFVPGKRAGVPEAMWHEQPILFELK